MKTSFVRASVLLIACMASQAVALGYQYTVQDLTSLIGGYSGTYGLNDFGDLTGSVGDGPFGHAVHEPFRFTHSSGLERLGLLNGAHGWGSGINNAGQVAGEISVPVGDGTTGNRHGFLYTPGIGMVDIGSLGGAETEVFGMNNLGQVVGFSETGDATGASEYGYVFTPGIGIVSLGGLTPGEASHAHGINDQGTVVGKVNVFVNAADQVKAHAFRYTESEGMVDLGALWDKGTSHARAINNNGIIVGDSTVFGGAIEATIWVDDQIQSIGTLGRNSRAWDINDAGVVLGEGTTLDGYSRAFIWTEQSGMQELNTLINAESGWTLVAASEINNAGQIIGYGNYQGETRYFLLNPIPEPSSWALMGLGALAWLLHLHWRKS